MNVTGCLLGSLEFYENQFLTSFGGVYEICSVGSGNETV